MEDIKRIEAIVKKCRVQGFNIIARKNGWPTSNKWEPADSNGIADLKSLVLAYQKGEADARSKDTDLIKDMLPYMQHKEDCGINANPWTEDGSPGPECTCTCGLSEVLQRINDRSK